MKKIRVLVNGVLDQFGSAAARNVLRMSNMSLIPLSITKCGDYRKFPINQTVVDLVSPEEITQKCASGILFNYGRPDVVVDCNPNSIFKIIIPDGLCDKTSFILSSAGNVEQDVKRLKREINGLGVNIVLMQENYSEKEILEAINFLYKKNEAKIFGQVFLPEEIAA
jgi:hypothetical protein